MADVIPIYQTRNKRFGEWQLSEFKMPWDYATGEFVFDDWEIIPGPVEYRMLGEYLYLPVNKSRRTTPREGKSRDFRRITS